MSYEHQLIKYTFVKGIEKPDSVVEKKLGAIERFANVLAPLGDQVFNIGDSVSIFYDLTGPLIAFNRNGSIFMNLRPFEEWRTFDSILAQYLLTHSYFLCCRR